MPSLGPSLPLSPPPCLLPLAGDGPVCSWIALLWDRAQFFLCSAYRPEVCLGWLIFSLLLSHSLSCYLTLAPSDCPQGIQAPVLTLSNASSSTFRSHLLVADAGVWGTFLLGVAFRHVICVFYLFFLPVRLPSEIRKLPPDPPVRGFLAFGNFLYYDFLPGTGLHP